MTADDTSATSLPDAATSASLLRLRVATDGDPSVLPRLLGLFQNLNITPRRVLAEFGSDAKMHVCIDVWGLSGDRLTRIARKMGETPSVLHAHWHQL
jgi:hypothetical protein